LAGIPKPGLVDLAMLEGADWMARVRAAGGGIIGQLADAQRIISKKGLAFSRFPRHNPFMLDAEVERR
jgi:hypothetical protein